MHVREYIDQKQNCTYTFGSIRNCPEHTAQVIGTVKFVERKVLHAT